MKKHARIVVDVNGGDYGPSTVLEGIEQALSKDKDIEVVACGFEKDVTEFAAEHKGVISLHATQNIEMGEHAAKAVREKKDSSIVVGCKYVKSGQADAFFSCGSTGACMSAATLYMGRIKGVKRPAMCMIFPSVTTPTVTLDIGANADCKPEYLVTFARMGQACAKAMLGCKEPSIALLNIGEEDEKGSVFSKQCNALFHQKVEGFVGNAEGKDIMYGNYDVVVADGYSGNIALKSIEGASKLIFKELKDAMFSSVSSKIGALLLKSKLFELKVKFSPETYGGAQLLGVNGVCLVGHGNYDSSGVCNGILATAKAVRGNTVELIAEAIASGK